MKYFYVSLTLVGLLLSPVFSQDDIEATETETQAEAAASDPYGELDPQWGTIVLKGGLAELNVPEDYVYLDEKDTNKVLVAWGNPARENLGMLYPEDKGIYDPDGYAVILTYEEEGHVKDDDAKDMNYDKLMKQMKEQNIDNNKEREAAGYGVLQLVGWAEEPHYDAKSHKIYWALAFDTGNDVNTLNYNVRVLGREGVMSLNAISTVDHLAEIKTDMVKVMDMASFTKGNLYTEYDPSIDKLAGYSIGGLIAGKIALKAGLFKGLIALLLAGKKIVIAAVIGIGALAKKIFGKSDAQQA